ncbi:putative di- and tripeptidase DUG2 [Wickerhamiella sorbophila]|uniref:Putative di-and tripeptidase DUG2 n=1 Tax=Wickerhamiella sorbophila TaxID=45607 RepID=A0A2T0FMP8_9ASCO|nr:putative di- and tripeptidase DUG2 [Wickerhamiella sorbophila]PRT56250.1 putative di- and tripeptidase DUG2 [Wickerhamiella sorbophila]
MDIAEVCTGPSQRESCPPALEPPPAPSSVHMWRIAQGATAAVAWNKWLYVGTANGSLVVFDLDTYQQLHEFDVHTGSMITLVVHKNMLFSGSSDSLLKVWSLAADELPVLLHTIYCLEDIGDIFCIAYVEPLRTVYFGTQNASIQWVTLPETANSSETSTAAAANHPAVRPSRFFDSAGPGGKLAPPQTQTKQLQIDEDFKSDETLLEVPLKNCINFAHNGFVYCMKTTQISANEPLIVSGSADGTVKAWTVGALGVLTELRKVVCPDGVFSMDIVADWQLYCGLESGRVMLIDLETWQALSYRLSAESPFIALVGVGDAVYAMADDTIFYHLPSTSTTVSWKAPGIITSCSISEYKPNHLITSTAEGQISLYSLVRSTPSPAPTGFPKEAAQGLTNDDMISTLSRLVRYQTVSSRDGQFWSECRRCASALRDHMRSLGAESDLWRVEKGNPIVYARFKANAPGINPGKIVFYGHYDVIEASGGNWKTPPFELTSIDGYIYGRGVSDNKGPCLAAIYAAAELYSRQSLPNDMVFLIEGEEESGSHGFLDAVTKHREEVGDVDWVIFSNSYWLTDSRPCLNYGLRGIVYAKITITSDKADVHSGIDGGAAREPGHDMVQLLARLTEPTGEIAIPNFSQSVLDMSPEESELLDETVATEGFELNRSDLTHKWFRPSLTIHKMNVSAPNPTVISSRVTAYVSIRIVPNQSSAEIKKLLNDHLSSVFSTFKTPNRMEIEYHYDADPWLGDYHSSPYRIMTEALTEEWDGVGPLFVREGGSIPMARALEKLFDAPAAQLPCGQSSDRAHLTNERLRITNLLAARNVFVKLFKELRSQN